MSLSHTSDISCSRATAAVRAGIDRDTAYGAVTPPIVLSSNFSFDGFGNKRQYDYTRSGNPTRDLLGEALADKTDDMALRIAATITAGWRYNTSSTSMLEMFSPPEMMKIERAHV